MPDREKLISANALIEHLDRSIAESKGLIGSTCVAIKCYVEQMPAVDMPKWIPVTERLPEYDKNVLVVDRITGEITTAYLNMFDSFVFKNGRGHGASYWMPLPEPPKEVE